MNIEIIKEDDFFQGKLFLVFLVGFILGISFKNIAVDKVTIGYNDYKLKSLESNYSLEKKDSSLKKQEK